MPILIVHALGSISNQNLEHAKDAPRSSRKRSHTSSSLNILNDSTPVESFAPTTDSRLASSRPKKRRRRAAAVGSAFDAEPSDVDSRWIDLPERETTFGRRPDPLVRLITRPCHPSSQAHTGENHYFRCINSSLCRWTQKSIDRQLYRIYTHAARCSALRRWNPDWYNEAGVVLANMAPGGIQPLRAGGGENQDTSAASLLSSGLTSTYQAQVPEIAPNPFSKLNATRSMSQHEKTDHAIAKLIRNSGTSPRLVDETAWEELLLALGALSDYSSPNSSYLRDKLIPAEAKRTLILIQEFLASQSNIGLSFDGLSAGEQPVYTVHTSTADRRSFLYRGDVFYGSRNTDYVVDLLEQVVNEIGPHRISSVVSDDTNTTKKAQRMVAMHHPSILNLADPIHKLNLCIQDICLDRLWVESVTKTPLTHFKISTYATGRLKAARLLLGLSRSLQSIGKTQFATMYYSGSSILVNLPALYKIYREHEINTVGTPLPEGVAEILDKTSVPAMDFRKSLTQLVNVIEPFARVLCLESTHSTLSDVYFFWLAALAALSQCFKSKQSRLSMEDKLRLQSIVYRRFNEAIDDAPTDIYVSAFLLDPRHRTSSIFSNLSQFNNNSALLISEKSSSIRMTRGIYERIRKQLLTMLRHELEVAENVPDHLLYQYDALRAKNELDEQLSQYYPGQPPFQQYSSQFSAPLQYWTLHRVSQFSFILAYLAEKVFSVLPNSMCDERTGSR